MRFLGTFLPAAVLLAGLSMQAQVPPGEGPPGEGPPEAGSGDAPVSLPRSYPVNNGTLVVAPGLALPNGNLPWVLDETGGKQALVPLHHATLTEAAPNSPTASIAGARSANVLHRTTPVVFIHTSDRTENSRESGRIMARPLWILLPLQTGTGSRLLTRPPAEELRNAVGCPASTICITADVLNDGWLRVVAAAPLSPGDYVLMPAFRPVKAAVDVVYDFTLDPSAPLAKDAISPGASRQPQTKPGASRQPQTKH